MEDQFQKIFEEIKADPMNQEYTKKGIDPLYYADADARILIVGQAPGRVAQDTQIVWNDKSGDRLRDWMGVSHDEFYHSGKIADSKENAEKIAAELKTKNVTQGVISRVSTKSPYPVPGSKRNIVVIDFGIKHSILRELAERDCNCIVLPYTATAQEVLNLHPDGVLLSNGPGDPEEMVEATKMVREVEKHVPLMGICMGHQVFALANGAKTYKMKFGHRGFNHPVREIATGNIGFTSQNHGYAVSADSIDKDNLMITHVEVNDGTVEGLRHKKYPAFSVQFHPDATPGPHDEVSLFDDFMSMIDQRKEEERHA